MLLCSCMDDLPFPSEKGNMFNRGVDDLDGGLISFTERILDGYEQVWFRLPERDPGDLVSWEDMRCSESGALRRRSNCVLPCLNLMPWPESTCHLYRPVSRVMEHTGHEGNFSFTLEVESQFGADEVLLVHDRRVLLNSLMYVAGSYFLRRRTGR
jgi:hypothetical protein